MPFPVEPQAEMRPGVIELRWGDPDPDLIPVEQIGAAAGAALRAAGAAALNYGANEGPLVLREILAGRIARAEGHAPGLNESHHHRRQFGRAQPAARPARAAR